MNYLFITLGEFGVKEIILAMVILLIPYFLPTIIAFSKNRNNKMPIMLINLLLGWTIIGWLASLIWSCMPDKEDNAININNAHQIVSQPIYSNSNDISDHRFDSLKKLKELHDSGILSDQEFAQEKAKILGI